MKICCSDNRDSQGSIGALVITSKLSNCMSVLESVVELTLFSFRTCSCFQEGARVFKVPSNTVNPLKSRHSILFENRLKMSSFIFTG